jgi:hypothetical protein
MRLTASIGMDGNRRRTTTFLLNSVCTVNGANFPLRCIKPLLTCISKYYNKKPKVFMLNSMLKLNPAFGLTKTYFSKAYISG